VLTIAAVIIPVEMHEKSVPDVRLLNFLLLLLLDAKPRELMALASQQTTRRLLKVSKNTKC
jgi:hypothetical protein